MLKKLVLLLTIFTSSCGWLWGDDDFYLCPMVSIPRDTAYVVKQTEGADSFRVDLKGFEGYCYSDARVKADKAVVTPVFKIKRLRPSDETDVHFSYFIETVNGPPEFLGKKTFHTMAVINEGQREIEFKGKSDEIRIPPEETKIDIIMGLAIGGVEKTYKQKTFDIDFKYEE